MQADRSPSTTSFLPAYCPAAHGVQNVRPAAAAAVPVGHKVQLPLTFTAAEKRPGAHNLHSPAASYFAAGQATHAERSVSDVSPGAQRAHAAAPARAREPGAQSEHAFPSGDENRPREHGLHSPAPALSATDPGAHQLQFIDATGAYWPALQLAHVVPPLGTYLPAGHASQGSLGKAVASFLWPLLQAHDAPAGMTGSALVGHPATLTTRENGLPLMCSPVPSSCTCSA